MVTYNRDSIHERITRMFEDKRTHDAARTLDEELGRRILPWFEKWMNGDIASHELVNCVIGEAARP